MLPNFRNNHLMILRDNNKIIIIDLQKKYKQTINQRDIIKSRLDNYITKKGLKPIQENPIIDYSLLKEKIFTKISLQNEINKIKINLIKNEEKISTEYLDIKQKFNLELIKMPLNYKTIEKLKQKKTILKKKLESIQKINIDDLIKKITTPIKIKKKELKKRFIKQKLKLVYNNIEFEIGRSAKENEDMINSLSNDKTIFHSYSPGGGFIICNSKKQNLTKEHIQFGILVSLIYSKTWADPDLPKKSIYSESQNISKNKSIPIGAFFMKNKTETLLEKKLEFYIKIDKQIEIEPQLNDLCFIKISPGGLPKENQKKKIVDSIYKNNEISSMNKEKEITRLWNLLPSRFIFQKI